MPKIFSTPVGAESDDAIEAAPEARGPNGFAPMPRASTSLPGLLAGDSRTLRLGLACGVAFGVLATLVGVGALAGVDQWSVEHLMPAATPEYGGRMSILSQVFPVIHFVTERTHPVLGTVTDALVWWAALAPALVLTIAGAVYLFRRGRQRLALALAVAFAAFNLVEYIAKTAITRPNLYARAGGHFHLGAFDSSFPSGHAGRAVILAICLVACLPRARRAIALWLALALSFLIVGAWHTPSDVAGGILLAITLLLGAARILGLARHDRQPVQRRGSIPKVASRTADDRNRQSASPLAAPDRS